MLVGTRLVRAWGLLAAALIVIIGFAAIGQPLVEVLSNDITVLPPSAATRAFRVTNQATQERTLALTTELPSGWSVLAMPQSLTLSPGEAGTVLMLVRIPSGGQAGAYNVNLCVQDPVDGMVCATAVVTLEPHLAIHIEARTALAKGLPGATARFDLLVTNRGNLTSEYEVLVRTGGWLAAASPSRFTLLPGEVKALTVTQFIPSIAIPGDSDTIHVSVMAIVDPTVTAQTTIRSGVLPLPAAQVSTDLGLVLDTSTDFIIEATAEGVTRSVATITASGQAIGGIVSGQAVATNFLGGGAFDLSSIQGRFTNEFLTVAYGPGSQRYGRFLSLSGEGIAVELRSGAVGMDAIVLDSGSGEKQGAQFSIHADPFDASFGWANLMVGATIEDVVAGCVEVAFAPSFLMAGEFARGEDGTAAYFLAQTQAGFVALRGEVSVIKAPFLGHLTQSGRSISFDGSASLSGMSLSSSFSHAEDWDYTIPDEKDLDQSVRLGISGGIGSGRFSFSGLMAWSDEWDVGVVKESSDQRLYGAWSQSWDSVLSISLSGSIQHEESELTATEFLLSDVSLGVNANVGTFRFAAGFGVAITKDVLLASTSTRITERVSLARNSTQLPVAMSLVAEQEDGDLISLVAELSLGNLTLSIERDEDEDMLFGLTYTLDFPYTVSSWLAKGQIEGMVYVDENMNGRRDENERGLEGILLSIDHTQALTDRDGQFRFPPKEIGDYQLQTLNLPATYVSVDPLPLPFRLSTPGVRRMNVGVVEAASVRGRVVVVPGDQTALGSAPFLLGAQRQTNGNGTISGAGGTGSAGLANIRITLTDGRTTLVQTTDAIGSFRFDCLLPGQWTISVDETSLPRFHEMSAPSALLQLQPGQSSELEIQVRQIPRPIEMLGIQGKSVSVNTATPGKGN